MSKEVELVIESGYVSVRKKRFVAKVRLAELEEKISKIPKPMRLRFGDRFTVPNVRRTRTR